MRNGGCAAMPGEFSDDDVEKQRVNIVVGGALAKAASVGQSQDLVEKTIDLVVVDCANKGEPQLERSSTSHEECRVCQEENEEALINLGCQCRGGLAKAHQSCIVKWFATRDKLLRMLHLLIPRQTSYWVWRVDPAVRVQEQERRCFSPLWVAFSILIGGLLLDVLISITLGVSALPVNIIIGVIVVLGLGTALRLALEFCQEWNVRRVVQRVEGNAAIGYHPTL
ncbi:RING/FYVE/PHD zinc finger superfamily protein [Striga asiatica]|uniref:RING/FYVE/PHD zinc finger superfamily protein n=1 Tax=Striga asiatica TaxID=4170 RepID=A0A5A7RL85_STRAF|nr:RING/FYVE/PHD zinc finger superfamily protein [Striga asiatica]